MKLLKLLLITANKFVLLKPIFKEIAGFNITRKNLNRKEKGRIQTAKRRLLIATLGKLDNHIHSKDNHGYMLKLEEGMKFFLIEDFSENQQIN
jgi:hypothetical protein